MSLRDELVAAVDAVLNKHGIAEPVDTTQDNPVTATLGPDGEWVPSYLKTLAEKAALKYPNGESTEQEFQFLPPRWIRKKAVWPVGLLASASIYAKDGKLARTDLTDRQKDSLHQAHNYTMVTTVAGNENQLQFLRVTSAEKGPDLFMLPAYYAHYPERLERDIRGYFRGIGVE